MAPIRVHEFISLDGVIDTPVWTADFGFDPRMGEAIGQVVSSSDGILLGRTTYQMFEPAWSQRTVEDDPGAPFFNDTVKYVVSSTLTETTWRNSQLIGRYDAKEIQRLKDDESADGLYVSGSGTLVRALLADGQSYFLTAWWIATFPGLAIFLLVLGFNLLGDALRDSFDPRRAQ